MGNQLIRGQVFDVLFNYVKRADGIYTESDCATVRDEICLRIDQSKFTADEAEEHINQEVEKRIAERMEKITDDEIVHEIKNDLKNTHNIMSSKSHILMRIALTRLRSRLTQKTEGGGE